MVDRLQEFIRALQKAGWSSPGAAQHTQIANVYDEFQFQIECLTKDLESAYELSAQACEARCMDDDNLGMNMLAVVRSVNAELKSAAKAIRALSGADKNDRDFGRLQEQIHKTHEQSLTEDRCGGPKSQSKLKALGRLRREGKL